MYGNPSRPRPQGTRPLAMSHPANCDKIEIRGLVVRAILGINDDERVNRQNVVIHLTLFADTRPAAVSDSIDDTVNYRSVAKQVIALAESTEYFLVERLAAKIAELCLEDERVKRTIVQVEKPDALRFAESVGVTIERDRASKET